MHSFSLDLTRLPRACNAYGKLLCVEIKRLRGGGYLCHRETLDLPPALALHALAGLLWSSTALRPICCVSKQTSQIDSSMAKWEIRVQYTCTTNEGITFLRLFAREARIGHQTNSRVLLRRSLYLYQS